MAVVFYALAAFFALRAAAATALQGSRRQLAAAGVAFVILGLAWQSRAAATIEIARIFALRNQMEWLVILPARRAEFAERPTYLRIMQSMIPQGTRPGSPRPAPYPRWATRTLGLPPAGPGTAFVYSLADAIARDDVQQAYGFLREGQDPNEPIAVEHQVLTGGRTLPVLPLTWAVATDSRQAVMMLLGHGATAEPRAVCLAETLGREEMVEILRRYGPPLSSGNCPVAQPGELPMLSYVAGSS
jgi:hypothetical protein